LLIFFLILFGFALNEKTHRLGCRRAWMVPDLSGRLLQAMAVRRHGGPVMMVVTVIAGGLHLFKT